MKTASTTIITLKFIFTKSNGDRTLRDVPVDSMEEFSDALAKALFWADPEVSEVKGRKAHVFAPGWFSTTTVAGVVTHWLPRNEDKLAIHFVPELDYSI